MLTFEMCANNKPDTTSPFNLEDEPSMMVDSWNWGASHIDFVIFSAENVQTLGIININTIR